MAQRCEQAAYSFSVEIPSHADTIPDQTCDRCGGLLAQEYCFDLLDGTGEKGFWALRCFQCGEMIDPIILHNRRSELPAVRKGGARIKPVLATSEP